MSVVLWIHHSRSKGKNTVTIYFEGDYEGNYYDATFDTEDEAIDYLCGLSSLINAKKLEV